MQYAYDIYCKIARLLGMDKKPSLELVACTDGVLSTCVQSMEHVDTVRPRLVSLLNEALDKLIRAREIEGAKLHNEIIHHLDKAEKMLVEIRKCIPEEQKISNEHAKKRICNLAQNANVSEERLAQELAIIAEHSDVTEELARLTSHIKQFRKLLNENVPHGRELDFFIQEMNREVNTLCSKFHSVPVVHNAISVRAELEKIREQVQNVE
jgi:uncharacterized protein (TIGR00255 family)